jgi:hypothetical protein
MLSIVLPHFEKDNKHGLLNSSGLRLVPYYQKKEMKFIDAKYQIQVGYWVARNHLKDYKIYAIMICMFDEDFFNNSL